MAHRLRKLLEDILGAADFILNAAIGKTLEDYKSNQMLRQAVERNFEIIGEAMNRLLKVAPEIYEIVNHASLIVGFRNALVHGYDLIDEERVWNTIQSDVPALAKQITTLIRTFD